MKKQSWDKNVQDCFSIWMGEKPYFTGVNPITWITLEFGTIALIEETSHSRCTKAHDAQHQSGDKRNNQGIADGESSLPENVLSVRIGSK